MHLRFFLFLIIIFCSCKSNNDDNLIFIEEYGDSNFSDFFMTRFIIRGYEKQQTLVAVTINESNKNETYANVAIDSLNNVYFKNDFEYDRLKLKELTLKFMEFEINYLEVDDEQNVKINVDDSETYDLIKINDVNQYFKNKEINKYKKINNNWYSR